MKDERVRKVCHKIDRRIDLSQSTSKLSCYENLDPSAFGDF